MDIGREALSRAIQETPALTLVLLQKICRAGKLRRFEQ
jgi:hypothetical protein